MPAPFSAFCALNGPRMAPRNACHERWSPSETTLCERSGSYRPSSEACAKMSVPPSEAGCWSLPSILVGRPRWLSTSSGLAYPPSVTRGGVKHAGGRESHFPAGARKGRSARAAVARIRSCRPGRATRPSPSGIRDAKPNRPTRMRLWEIRGAGLLEIFGAGEFFERAPVFGTGFLGRIVRRRGVDLVTDRVRFRLLARADVFSRFDLNQAAVRFLVVCHCFILSSLRDSVLLPMSPALTCRAKMTPLRGVLRLKFPARVSLRMPNSPSSVRSGAFALHRWHVLHFVMSFTLRTLYFFSNAAPSSI